MMIFSPAVLLPFLFLNNLIGYAACMPQQLPATTATPTATRSTDDTHAVACATGGGDWFMDPLVARRLSEEFCRYLVKPNYFPGPGGRAESLGYPSDLGPIKQKRTDGGESFRQRRDEIETEASQTMNTTLIETSGAIAEFAFQRSSTQTLESTVLVSGTDEQCARDNCTEGMRRAINSCKFNSHLIGGLAMFLTDCGLYSMLVQNCSGNYVDPDCALWHVRWPDVGLKENETLYWNITHGIGGSPAGGDAGASKVILEGERIDLRGLSDRLDEVTGTLTRDVFHASEMDESSEA